MLQALITFPSCKALHESIVRLGKEGEEGGEDGCFLFPAKVSRSLINCTTTICLAKHKKKKNTKQGSNVYDMCVQMRMLFLDLLIFS